MTQSRKSSLAESVINVAIGCVINFLANMLILPMVGCHITPRQNLVIMLLFTGISIARSYCIRRWFNGSFQNMMVRTDK